MAITIETNSIHMALELIDLLMYLAILSDSEAGGVFHAGLAVEHCRYADKRMIYIRTRLVRFTVEV